MVAKISRKDLPKTKVTCHVCGYSWGTTTKMMFASCPCCGAKVKVEHTTPIMSSIILLD